LAQQIDQINRKAAIVEAKMTPFRLHASYKFNSLWDDASNSQRVKMVETFRKRFKSFMCLPRSTPNKQVERMIGEVEGLVGG
jgi:hypothetical protein